MQALAKFEYSSLIGQGSNHWSLILVTSHRRLALRTLQTQKIKVSLSRQIKKKWPSNQREISCQIKRIRKFNCIFIRNLTPLCNARAMFLFLSSFVAIVMSQRSFIFIFCISIECRDKLQMV